MNKFMFTVSIHNPMNGETVNLTMVTHHTPIIACNGSDVEFIANYGQVVLEAAVEKLLEMYNDRN